MAVTGLLFSCSKDDGLFKEESLDHQYGYEKVNTEVQGLDQDRFVTMQSIDLKVHYRIIGKGPVDMVFIPGWTNPLTVYTKQFDYFRDKARCIYIDLPGHGLSDAPEGIEYTQSLMADAIYDVIRKEGVKKFVGVGFSWGWKPLQLLEMKHPGMITQLVLLDVGVPSWPPIGGMSQEIREAQYATHMAWTIVEKTPSLKGDPEYDEIFKYYIVFPNWLLANMYYHFLAEEVCQPYPWDIPILGIWRTDPNQSKMNLFFPGVEIHLIVGKYHVIQWFQADIVNQLIDDFIADRPGMKY
jgi:pimeloyl-ACP methyl ester carboxylesterase